MTEVIPDQNTSFFSPSWFDPRLFQDVVGRSCFYVLPPLLYQEGRRPEDPGSRDAPGEEGGGGVTRDDEI